MNFRESIENLKRIHNQVLNFIDKGDDQEEMFQNIIKLINDHQIAKNAHHFKMFLYMISKILSNHYRYPNFFTKIEKIIQRYKTEIKQFFSSNEIYQIFEKCPKFLLFLFSENIIELDKETYDIMTLENYIYLFPKKAFEDKHISRIPENYEKNQQIGENEDLICQMIRDDSIDEFITYVNKNDYPLNSYIQKSIFETNSFLIKNKPTLIEYASFYGSTQIFKYLFFNEAEITSSIWLYAIHSDNPEMIHLLEENHINPPNESYEKCIKESIKCHHNDIMNYILSNFIKEDIENIEQINFEEKYKENIYSYCFHYYNFSYFPKEIKHQIFFYYACKYDYIELVEYFMKTEKIDVNQKIIITNIFNQIFNSIFT